MDWRHVETLFKDFSLEMTGKDASKLEDARATIPPGTRINVAFLENEDVRMRLDAVRAAKRFAEPGTAVSVVWGEHPGEGTSPDVDLGFPRIRATVAPAPYDAHARTQYRRS